jgi:hypothetical protein
MALVNLAIGQNQSYNYSTASVESNPPKVKFYGDAVLQGQPTISNLARGLLAQTGIQFTNTNQFHICDPLAIPQPKNTQRRVRLKGGGYGYIANPSIGSPVLALNTLFKSSAVTQIISQIRNAIESALTAIFGPIAGQIKAAALYIARVLAQINYYIKFATKVARDIAQAIGFVTSLVKWIKNLPNLLLKAFAECLIVLENALKFAESAFSIDLGISAVLNEVNQLNQNVNQAQAAAAAVEASYKSFQTTISSPVSTNAGINALNNAINGLKNSQTKPIINVKIV